MFDIARLRRRELLGAAAASGALSLLPGVARADTPADPSMAQLAGFANELLQLAPESATSLGLDKGDHDALRA